MQQLSSYNLMFEKYSSCSTYRWLWGSSHTTQTKVQLAPDTFQLMLVTKLQNIARKTQQQILVIQTLKFLNLTPQQKLFCFFLILMLVTKLQKYCTKNTTINASFHNFKTFEPYATAEMFCFFLVFNWCLFSLFFKTPKISILDIMVFLTTDINFNLVSPW